MTCSDLQRVLPEFLDGAPDGAADAALRVHVKSCPDCSDLISDLKLIAGEARKLAETETDEPAQRVWVHIAAQLRAEGIIHDPEPALTRRPTLVPSSPARRWFPSAWWLAPVAAAILAAGAYVVNHKPAPQVANVAPTILAPPPAVSSATPSETSSVAEATNSHPADASNTPVLAASDTDQLSQKSSAPDLAESAARTTVEPGPSVEDQQFLSEVSTRAPSMRASYESQLRAVNADIREVQNYLKRNPQDADARQQLMDAYQQKAVLYQMALDRIQ